MTKVLDKSRDDLQSFKVVKGYFQDLEFRALYRGDWSYTVYKLSNVKTLEEFDADEYRSASQAAFGAIVGGLLTGGAGVLAGAAIGGRRKKTGSFVVAFDDGTVVAFHEKGNAAVKALRDFLAQPQITERVKRLQSSSD